MSDLIEDKSFTVEAARAAIAASGELEAFDGPHFRIGRDGAWDSVFLADDKQPHPDFARVIITRRGQAPREVAIGWADYAEIIEADNAERVAAEREWVATRARKPMTIFGSEAERHGYRVIFADVLAPLLGRGPRPAAAGKADATPTSERDWAAEIAGAQTIEQLDAVVREGRGERVFTPNKAGVALDLAQKARRRELSAAVDAAWTPEPAHDVPAESTAPERPATRDYLPPQNRAERRKSARKKGGKR